MFAVALSWECTACEAVKVVDQIIMRCNELSGLFDMLSKGILLTKLTLVKSGG